MSWTQKESYNKLIDDRAALPLAIYDVPVKSVHFTVGHGVQSLENGVYGQEVATGVN